VFPKPSAPVRVQAAAAPVRTLLVAPLAVEARALVLAAATAPSGLAAGDLVVADVSATAPYGLLRRVVAVQVRGDALVLQTEDADLTQVGHAIEPGVRRVRILSASDTLTPRPTELLQPDAEGFLRLSFTGNLVGGAFASMTARIKPEFEWVWDKEALSLDPKLMRVKMTLRLKDLKLNGVLGLKQSVQLAAIELPPISVWAGVPIVFRNKLKLSAAGTVSVGSSLNSALSAPSGTLVVGLDYVRGVGWSNLSSADVQVQVSRPREVSPVYAAALDFPSLALESRPYGTGALRFSAQTGLRHQISHDVNAAKPLKVTSAANASVGMSVNFFGWIDQGTSYAVAFPGRTWYEGSLEGLIGEIAPIAPPSPAPSRSDALSDVRNTWAGAEIAFLVDWGALSGYPDGTFKPNNTVTRAEFAAMLVAVLNPSPKPECADRTFNDISGHWAAQAILKAARACYISGVSAGTFDPAGRVTKAQMLVALNAGLGLQGKQFGTLDRLSDVGQIPQWAYDAIANAAENDLVVNYPIVNTLSPAKNATRADVAATLYRALNWKGNMTNTFETAYVYVP
jgi:hypothetical protein